jgi:hypothetical protein
VNYLMVAVGLLQGGAGLYGFYLGTPRIAIMNLLVGAANIVLAGAHV